MERINYQPANPGVYTSARPRFRRRQFDDLVRQYKSEPDPKRRTLLEDAYREVTGKEIADARRPSLPD